MMWSGNHSGEDLAKCGYRLERKFLYLKRNPGYILAKCWYILVLGGYQLLNIPATTGIKSLALAQVTTHNTLLLLLLLLLANLKDNILFVPLDIYKMYLYSGRDMCQKSK